MEKQSEISKISELLKNSIEADLLKNYLYNDDYILADTAEPFSMEIPTLHGDPIKVEYIDSNTSANAYHTYTSSTLTNAGNWTFYGNVYTSPEKEEDSVANIMTKTWGGSPLMINSDRLNSNIFPIGTLPMSINDGIMLPVASKMLLPAIEESMLMLSGMSYADLASFIGTSEKYASILMPRIVSYLSFMFGLCLKEIAPGYSRADDGSLYMVGSSCRFKSAKKKSKFREALGKLPIAGMSAMRVGPNMSVVHGLSYREYDKAIRRNDFFQFNMAGSLSYAPKSRPLVVLYEVNRGLSYYLGQKATHSQYIFDQYIDIERHTAGHSGTFFIFMNGSSPGAVGPINSKSPIRLFKDAIFPEDRELPYEISKKDFDAAIKELVRLYEEIGPVHFVIYMDAFRMGIAQMRDVIAFSKETGSTFSFWHGSSYYRNTMTSYAKNLYFETFGERVESNMGRRRGAPSSIVMAASGISAKTLAYLLPESTYTPFAVQAKMSASQVISTIGSHNVYLDVKDINVITPGDKLLVAGKTKMYNMRNAVGVLLDSVIPQGPVFRLIKEDDWVDRGSWGIKLHASQEELLAQI